MTDVIPFVSGSQTVPFLFELYLFAFGAAAVACFVSLFRARQISNDDTRRGLVGLLITSGLWAAFHVGYLAAPTAEIQYGFYMAGLIVGLSTVGPWLYFCSAYTGRTLHRQPTYRWLAVGVYLFIVSIKLTNPIHGLYFTSEVTLVPFPHLLIQHGVLHWVAMGLAYSLALIGIFMLFELFSQVDYNTTPFVVLVGLTGLPVVFDVIGFVSPVLLDLTYSALGVAVFAVGTLFIYTDQFQTIQLAGQYDDPVIVLDDEQQIRDYNESARSLFPVLEDNIDEELSAVVPQVAVALSTDEPLAYSGDGQIRYYSISTNHFSTGKAKLGQLILFKDVTEKEQYRRELEAQNARLEQFTGMVSHDLRNPLNIAQGNLDLVRETGDDDALQTVETALDRMEALIADLLALARQGQPIDDTELVSLREIADSCWEMVDVADAELVVDGELELQADPERLQQLLENLFRNAVEHGGDSVGITVGLLDDDVGFYIEDTGPGIPEDTRETVFESGYTTNRGGTGLGLSIVKEIAEAHGWSIRTTAGTTGGARFEINTAEGINSDSETVATAEAEQPPTVDTIE